MNPPPHHSAEALAALVRAIFQRHGLTQEHAAQVADLLVWADLHGKSGHGVVRVQRYVALLQSGEMNPRPALRAVLAWNALTVIEADRAPGAVALHHAVAAAIPATRAHGTAFTLVRGTTHTGAIGYFAELLAAQGIGVLAGAASVPNMAYHGSRTPVLGTSPLAIALPGPAPAAPPVTLDMASSTISLGGLRAAQRAGTPLPPEAALDAAGAPTTDPERAATLLPLGGAKGSGLALMLELLASLLAGAPILAPHLGPEKRRRHTQNAFLWTLDLARLRDPALYQADLAALAATIRAQPRREGVDTLHLPGERGARTARERREHGIPVPPPLWEWLSREAG